MDGEDLFILNRQLKVYTFEMDVNRQLSEMDSLLEFLSVWRPQNVAHLDDKVQWDFLIF